MREGPDHYTRLKPEPIDVIRAWDLPWCPANALKYIARYRNKGGVEDLKKARHYLDLEIAEMEKNDEWWVGMPIYPPAPPPPPSMNDWLKPQVAAVTARKRRPKRA